MMSQGEKAFKGWNILHCSKTNKRKGKQHSGDNCKIAFIEILRHHRSSLRVANVLVKLAGQITGNFYQNILIGTQFGNL